jgi:hypothetical protein
MNMKLVSELHMIVFLYGILIAWTWNWLQSCIWTCSFMISSSHEHDTGFRVAYERVPLWYPHFMNMKLVSELHMIVFLYGILIAWTWNWFQSCIWSYSFMVSSLHAHETGFLNILGVRVIVFNAVSNTILVISWWPDLLMEETGVPGENHRLVACHWPKYFDSSKQCQIWDFIILAFLLSNMRWTC